MRRCPLLACSFRTFMELAVKARVANGSRLTADGFSSFSACPAGSAAEKSRSLLGENLLPELQQLPLEEPLPSPLHQGQGFLYRGSGLVQHAGAHVGTD